MNIKLLKRSRALWNVTNVSRETNRSNALKWARSINRLGDKWLFATFIEALPNQQCPKPLILDKWLSTRQAQQSQGE